MIKTVGNMNMINFRGTSAQRNEDIDFYDIEQMFRNRDKQNLRKQVTSQPSTHRTSVRSHTHNSEKVFVKNSNGDILEYTPRVRQSAKKKHKKRISPLAPMALTAAIFLSSVGISTCGGREEDKPVQTVEPTTIIISDPDILSNSAEGIIDIQTTETLNTETDGIAEFETSKAPYSEAEIANAVEAIKSDTTLSNVFYNLIATKNNMEACLDNPIETLEELLCEPWAKGVEIELLLPQIFFESSGLHYREDGTVRSSSANCNGFAQISEGVEHDMNQNHFSDNPQDRNDPLGNIMLGIAFDSELLNKYFEGDMFNALAGYNCGPRNARNGNYYGADEYAKDIIGYYNILKNNPQYTQMLLDGALDEYQNGFFVG